MLEEHEIDRIAHRVIELLHEQQDGLFGRGVRMVDAKTLAQRLGVERHWVYAHKRELGGVRLGGPHGRLRFDLDQLPDRLTTDGRTGDPSKPHRPARRDLGTTHHST